MFEGYGLLLRSLDDTHAIRLGPKYTTQPGMNEWGSLKLSKTRQREACNGPCIYYTVKQKLETMLYKPVCHRGFKVSCTRTHTHSYDM